MLRSFSPKPYSHLTWQQCLISQDTLSTQSDQCIGGRCRLWFLLVVLLILWSIAIASSVKASFFFSLFFLFLNGIWLLFQWCRCRPGEVLLLPLPLCLQFHFRQCQHKLVPIWALLCYNGTGYTGDCIAVRWEGQWGQSRGNEERTGSLWARQYSTGAVFLCQVVSSSLPSILFISVTRAQIASRYEDGGCGSIYLMHVSISALIPTKKQPLLVQEQVQHLIPQPAEHPKVGSVETTRGTLV